MITAGSVRGKCCVPQAVQSIMVPGALRRRTRRRRRRRSGGGCASASARAHARGSTRPAAAAGRRPRADRSKLALLRRQQRQRIVGGADVDREHRRRVRAGRGTPTARRPCAPPRRAASVMKTRLGLPVGHAAHQVARAPDRREQRVGVRAAPRRSRPRRRALGGAVERAAGVGVRAAGADRRPWRADRATARPATGNLAALARDAPISSRGRSAADGRLANPVRSGRKQPQRVSARVVRSASHRSRPPAAASD